MDSFVASPPDYIFAREITAGTTKQKTVTPYAP